MNPIPYALALVLATSPSDMVSDGGVVELPPARAWDHPVELADGGTLPPGVFFPQPTFEHLNNEVQKLQNQPAPVPSADWLLLSAGVGLVLGIVTGIFVGMAVNK